MSRAGNNVSEYVTRRYKKMNVQIKASDEAGHRVLRETNRKRPACMRKAGKQQYAQRQKKTCLTARETATLELVPVVY